jgi:hypothetical protein
MPSDKSDGIIAQKAVLIRLDLSHREGPPPGRFITIDAEGEPIGKGWLFTLSEARELRSELSKAIIDLEQP